MSDKIVFLGFILVQYTRHFQYLVAPSDYQLALLDHSLVISSLKQQLVSGALCDYGPFIKRFPQDNLFARYHENKRVSHYFAEPFCKPWSFASFSEKCDIKFIFSCYQAALRTLLSIHLSVCPSVRPSITPYSQCSCYLVIMKFAGVITMD